VESLVAKVAMVAREKGGCTRTLAQHSETIPRGRHNRSMKGPEIKDVRQLAARDTVKKAVD
jgi:hypothetical protein